MDFETRQRLAVDEVNTALSKYGVALQPFLDIRVTGVVPQVRLIDVEKQTETNLAQKNATEETKTKKGKK